VQIASTTDYKFAEVNALSVTCLTWTDAGIFACADQATAKFSVGLSKDQGKTFEPMFQPPKLTLKVCGGGTPVATSCPNAWHGLAPIIGADPATSGYPAGNGGSGPSAGSAGTAGMPSGQAGSGGANAEGGTTSVGGGSAGATSSAAAGGTSAGGSSGVTPAQQSSTSSGCSFASPARGAELSILLGLTGALALLRKKRRI
jgi:hypothetical protein